MTPAAHAVVTLARRGLLTPAAPHRVPAQIGALRRWGYGLGGSLLSAAARSPSRVALADPAGTLTYAEVRDQALRLARSLRQTTDLPAVQAAADGQAGGAAVGGGAGIGPGDRVGVLCRNHRGFVLSAVALSLLGADVVLINTAFSAAQIAAVVRDHGLRLVVHDPEFSVSGTATLSSAGFEALPDPGGPLTPPRRPGPTVVLTSGTTGTPKGARRPNPAGLGPLVSILDRIPVQAGDRLMIAAPLFHTWGYAALQLAFGLRASVVLTPRFAPESLVDTVRTHRCTGVFAVPVMLSRLLDAGAVLPGVRVVAVSGSALPGDLATRFMDTHGDVLYNLYGSTEVSWASVATPAELRRSPATAGRPPRGTRVMILGADGSPVPPGTVGRIFVGNDMLFEGYAGDLGGVESRDGLLATGDLGVLDASGLLTVSGRADDMVVSGGENVFPSAVEDLLATLPGVREVAVVGVPDPTFGQRLAAHVVCHAGASVSADDVREHVRRHGAAFAVPRDVRFLAALPRTATGKVIKRAL
ncbi:AMP-binding protein [Asanoa siamensis]|uniref:Fatty-acyl-CoA synthase n=1 Tax=Asanoa siamensis TaxID=926357 RepID=A0ABQ4CTS5_9ACTN|nr:AMP-binding protein [Asanoa siamensis]GIF74690.1 fatty-acyl-CoA synthase [Asanoa siamensis]